MAAVGVDDVGGVGAGGGGGGELPLEHVGCVGAAEGGVSHSYGVPARVGEQELPLGAGGDTAEFRLPIAIEGERATSGRGGVVEGQLLICAALEGEEVEVGGAAEGGEDAGGGGDVGCLRRDVVWLVAIVLVAS